MMRSAGDARKEDVKGADDGLGKRNGEIRQRKERKLEKKWKIGVAEKLLTRAGRTR
jgi:hypothetical protein